MLPAPLDRWALRVPRAFKVFRASRVLLVLLVRPALLVLKAFRV